MVSSLFRLSLVALAVLAANCSFAVIGPNVRACEISVFDYTTNGIDEAKWAESICTTPLAMSGCLVDHGMPPIYVATDFIKINVYDFDPALRISGRYMGYRSKHEIDIFLTGPDYDERNPPTYTRSPYNTALAHEFYHAYEHLGLGIDSDTWYASDESGHHFVSGTVANACIKEGKLAQSYPLVKEYRQAEK